MSSLKSKKQNKINSAGTKSSKSTGKYLNKNINYYQYGLNYINQYLNDNNRNYYKNLNDYKNINDYNIIIGTKNKYDYKNANLMKQIKLRPKSTRKPLNKKINNFIKGDKKENLNIFRNKSKNQIKNINNNQKANINEYYEDIGKYLNKKSNNIFNVLLKNKNEGVDFPKYNIMKINKNINNYKNPGLKEYNIDNIDNKNSNSKNLNNNINNKKKIQSNKNNKYGIKNNDNFKSNINENNNILDKKKE